MSSTPPKLQRNGFIHLGVPLPSKQGGLPTSVKSSSPHCKQAQPKIYTHLAGILTYCHETFKEKDTGLEIIAARPWCQFLYRRFNFSKGPWATFPYMALASKEAVSFSIQLPFIFASHSLWSALALHYPWLTEKSGSGWPFVCLTSLKSEIWRLISQQLLRWFTTSGPTPNNLLIQHFRFFRRCIACSGQHLLASLWWYWSKGMFLKTSALLGWMQQDDAGPHSSSQQKKRWFLQSVLGVAIHRLLQDRAYGSVERFNLENDAKCQTLVHMECQFNDHHHFTVMYMLRTKPLTWEY